MWLSGKPAPCGLGCGWVGRVGGFRMGRLCGCVGSALLPMRLASPLACVYPPGAESYDRRYVQARHRAPGVAADTGAARWTFVPDCLRRLVGNRSLGAGTDKRKRMELSTVDGLPAAHASCPVHQRIAWSLL